MSRWLPVAGAVMVVIGAWLGGKYHPAGFIIAAVPICTWGGLHLRHWLRNRKKPSG